MAKASDKVVNDVETDLSVIVARAWGWAVYGGYESTVRTLLSEIGLGHMVGPVKVSATVTRDQVLTMLPETFELKNIRLNSDGSLNGEDLLSRFRNDAYGVITRQTDIVYSEAAQGYVATGVEATFETPESMPIDVEAVTKEWGRYTTALPVAGNDEVKAARRKLVTDLSAAAERHHLCDTFEAAVRKLGLGEYLPPAYGSLTVSVNGAETVVQDVPLTRSGQPRDLSYYLAEAIRKAGTDTLANGEAVTVSLTPATS